MSYIIAFVSFSESDKEFPTQCFRTDIKIGDEVVVRRTDGKLKLATIAHLKYLNWDCSGRIEWEFVRSGEVKDTVPYGSTYIASGNFTLEKQHGYWVQMSMPLERAGMKMYQNVLMYQFFFRGKAIGIMCHAGGAENEKSKIDDVFKRIQPLCQQVLNSVVLPQAY